MFGEIERGEPLRAEEADRLCHACQTAEEKLVIWTLLDTGLRVSELCSLTPKHVLWQQKSLRVPIGAANSANLVHMLGRNNPAISRTGARQNHD